MLERQGEGRLRPVVMDFGLARDSGATTVHGLTESGAVMGTPAYMSPEQARGDAKRLDRRSDVYSLGATLYDVLVGKPPFSDQTVVNIILKVLSDTPSPLRSHDPSLPEALELITSKCLNKEPQQRYPTALALAEDLDRYLSAGRVAARRLGLGYRLNYWARHNRTLAAVWLGLVLSATGLVGTGIRNRVVALRKEQQAREEAQLAQRLGQTVKDLEWLVRTSYLLPLHDTGYEKGIVRTRMAQIAEELTRTGEKGARLGAYVLGRGHLALHEWDAAYDQLKRAESLGYRDGELDYALGRVLGEKYSRALDEARKSGDKSFVEKRKKELEQEFLIPARSYLQKSRALPTDSPSYVEALIDFYNEHYDAALLNAHMARRQTPWLYEAAKLEGDVHMVRALQQRDHGDYATAQVSFDQAVARYEEAAAVGHSDHQVHEAIAEAWIRQEEMDFYRGINPEPKMQKAQQAADHALEAEPAGPGHVKRAFAYFFAGQYRHKSGDDNSALRWYSEQLKQATAAISSQPLDALSHDIAGNAFKSIADIRASRGNPDPESLLRSYNHYQIAIQINNRFPWAYNDYAGAMLIEAAAKSNANQSPTKIISEIIKTYKTALELDRDYIYAYAGIGSAYQLQAQWAADHGQCQLIDPAQFNETLNAAATINDNFWPIIWNAALFRYYSLLCNHIAETDKLRIDLEKLSRLAISVPDVHVLQALFQIFIIYQNKPSTSARSAAVESGLSAIKHCYAASADYPPCLAVEAQLLSVKANESDSPPDKKLKLLTESGIKIQQAVRVAPNSLDIVLPCSDTYITISTTLSQPKKKTEEAIREGLICANRAVAQTAGLPRPLAQRGALLLLLAKEQIDPMRRRALLRDAQESLGKALAANPFLQQQYGRYAQEAKRGQ